MSAALTTASKPAAVERDGRVPAEFIGLARALRRDVLRVDDRVNPALGMIVKPYAARLGRKPGLRREQLADIARRWEALFPTEYLLDRRITRDRNKSSVIIRELRICGSWWADDRWIAPGEGAGESGISLLLVELLASTKAAPKLTTLPIACLSLHCLGRWHERASMRGLGDLRRDLAALAARIDQRGDTIAVPSGVFLGEDVIARDTVQGCDVKVRSVRTFVAHESIAA